MTSDLDKENFSEIDGEIEFPSMEHDGINLNVHPSDDQFSDGSNSVDEQDQDQSQDRGPEASTGFKESDLNQPEMAYERLLRKVQEKRK